MLPKAAFWTVKDKSLQRKVAEKYHCQVGEKSLVKSKYGEFLND